MKITHNGYTILVDTTSNPNTTTLTKIINSKLYAFSLELTTISELASTLALTENDKIFATIAKVVANV